MSGTNVGSGSTEYGTGAAHGASAAQPRTVGGINRAQNPSTNIGAGKLEQAAGTLFSSQRLKDKGLEKEGAGRAARADAHSQVMQGHHGPMGRTGLEGGQGLC